MNLKRVKDYMFAAEQPVKGLFVIEWLTVGYVAFTTLFVLVFMGRIQNIPGVMMLRATALILILGLVALYRRWPVRLTKMLRVAVPVSLFSFWYPDLYELSRIFSNADHVFASLEYNIFGCQPSLEFAQNCTSPFLSECFYMGYFFFFPMIALVLTFYFVARYDSFEKTATIVLGSFLAYYLIFLFLPVAGPQYYFNAIGIEAAKAGDYQPVGLWFNDNIQMMDPPGWSDGLFYKILSLVRENERPVASFPSSHVGVSTIIMILAFKAKSKGLLAVLFPLWVFLCCATIYIRAHYVVDIIAGFLSAPLVYLFFSRILSQPVVGCNGRRKKTNLNPLA